MGGKVLVSTLHKAPPATALILWREKKKRSEENLFLVELWQVQVQVHGQGRGSETMIVMPHRSMLSTHRPAITALAITLLLPILCIDNMSSTSCMMDEIKIVLGFNLFPQIL